MNHDEAVRLSREAYSKSTIYFDSSVRNRIEADIRQVQGVHPHGSKYFTEQYRSKSKLFRPKTRTALRKAEAICAKAYFSTDDVVTTSAYDETNNMQHASAALMKELLNWRLQNTVPWFKILVGAFQEAYSIGFVFSFQSWKYDPQHGIDTPDVMLIPPENVRIDPASDWLDPVNTSPYVIIEIPMYVYQIKARMKSDKASKFLSVGDEKLKTSVKVGDSIRNQRERNQQDSKSEQSSVTDFSLCWVRFNIMRYDGVDWCYYTLNDMDLLSEPRLLHDVFPHLKGTNERPVVMGQGMIEAHKVFVDSHTTLTREIQNEINTLANARIDNVRLAMEKRWFVKRDRQVDVRSLLYGGANSVTLMNDPTGDVKEVSVNDVTGSSYQEQDRLNLDFDDMAGAFSQSSVQSNRNLNETVGGMTLLSNNSSDMAEYDLRVFNETWVEPVMKQIVLMEQMYETDEVIVALAGNKAKLVQKFGISEVDDALLTQKLTLKVNVGTGSTNSFNQLERLVYAIQSVSKLLGGSAVLRLKQDEIIKEIFGKVGYKDGGRFYMAEGDNPEIDNLIAQIQQLQQMLEQKQPPELIQAQIREINARADNASANKVKILVESIFSAMQAGGQIAMNPMIAPVGDKVMQAAGYQQPNPVGVDPNIPAITTQADMGTLPEIRENTSPLQPPVPASPMQGIETQDITD